MFLWLRKSREGKSAPGESIKVWEHKEIEKSVCPDCGAKDRWREGGGHYRYNWCPNCGAAFHIVILGKMGERFPNVALK